jgi:hypothetical protein
LETYQADEEFKQLSKRDLYYKMIKLMEQEEEVIKRVRKAEDEVNLIDRLALLYNKIFRFF